MKPSINNYKIVEKIGKGTYGSVYSARGYGDKLFAIKKLNYDQFKNGVPLYVIREISFLHAIQHPNVVRFVEAIVGSRSFYNEQNGQEDSFSEKDFDLCLVFELLSHDLSGVVLHSPNLFTRKHTVFVLRRVLQALVYLHEVCGVIHRDIKPSNIFISRGGAVKLGDFGLARLVDCRREEYTGNVVTPWYRAPEVLKGERKYDTKIDIWAVGCVMGEILLGEPLFSGNNDLQVLRKIETLLQPDTFRKTFQEFGQTEMDFLRFLLEKEPTKRPTAATALRHPFLQQQEQPIPRDIRSCHDMLIRQELKEKLKAKQKDKSECGSV